MNRMLRNRHQKPDIESDSHRADSLAAQNMAISLRDQPQANLPCRPASYATPASAFASRYLPPIQELKLPITDPAYLPSQWQKQNSCHVRHSSNAPVPLYDHQTPRLGHVVPESNGYQPHPHPEDMDNSSCHQEREPKRSRLEVQDWEKRVWARSERMHAMDNTSQQQNFPHVWVTSAHLPPELPPLSQTRQPPCQLPCREQPPTYPSPPYLLEESSRARSGYLAPSSRRPSSVFSGSTLSDSPGTRRTTTVSTSGASPPSSPAATSTFSDDTRPSSIAPDDFEDIPTFEQIYNVPQISLGPRNTGRTSILERFPTEVFMRIMMYVDWKQQILLKRCNTNLHHMVNLEAIPWELKTATLLYEENYEPRNFAKKAPKTKGAEAAEDEDTDDDLPSDYDAPLPTKGAKGKAAQKKGKGKAKTRRSKPQTKEKAHPDTLGKWACHFCFKILPAQFFEGKCLEENTSRSTKDQKKAQNTKSEKKSDMRVEYVRVVSVNPARVPEWLTKDMLAMRATGDVATYVRQRMEKGVNCDDLRFYYKDIHMATHCIAPVRGVTPVYTAASTATPPGCETYRPFFKIPGVNASRGLDSYTYTYEIGIPENLNRAEDPMVLPRSRPVGRILQPQKRSYNHFTDAAGPAPVVGDVIPLRRFCIPCGAKNGAYRRDCNRKILSKVDEGWWVCDCRQVRPAGKGNNCPDCGRKVIY
ncbi:hypothetical protein VMCG_03629 [Cytospora schulzeri]|uniref:F-box domain-containing protein n=1 Tax=Cytospora schulzeri TaxID=448051 RepID=A0A423WWS2_9PEZI|nr:hypothetical protein VMCG_03629 [Valsa malicola]